MNHAQDSLTDWIQLIFEMIAGIYALILYRQSQKENRNKFILEILNRIYNDDDVRTIIYAVDRGENVNGIVHLGQLEKQADKTIKLFDYIGFLIKEGNIKSTDIKLFRYEINRVLSNTTVINYIDWLKRVGVPLDNLDYIAKPAP